MRLALYPLKWYLYCAMGDRGAFIYVVAFLQYIVIRKLRFTAVATAVAAGLIQVSMKLRAMVSFPFGG